MLWQLPESFERDDDLLAAALDRLPRAEHCFEFRHPSWFVDPVYAALRRNDAALVWAEQEDFETPLVPTASWGYVRLHKPEYDEATITERKQTIAAQPW